jgi:membrane protein insertase Oxa1/YidC/SpoIIIJ
MLAEYRKAGVSPVSGPGHGLVLVQIPLGFALYSVIRDSVTGSNPFLWIANLANPDILISAVAARCPPSRP